MPNLKISQLPSATPPLTGTELVPIVQSGQTDKTTVADFALAGTGLTKSGNTISLTSPVTLTLGGTGASLTASNGGIPYSTGSALAILAGTATANQLLLSGSSAAPIWSTATYPSSTVNNQLLYSSSANTVAGLTTGNNGVLVTSAGGVPSISSTLPNATQDNITRLNTITSGTWNGSVVGSTYGGTGVNNGSSTITLAGSLTTSGANSLTLTTSGDTNVTLPTSGTLITSSVTSLPSLVTVNTITSGTWNGSVVGSTYGGTGVNNGSNTITLAGNLTTSGANSLTLTTSGRISEGFLRMLQ